MDNIKNEGEFYIRLFDTGKNTALLKDDRDNSLWVGKKIKADSVEIYNHLRGLKHKNIAYIRDVAALDGETYVIEELIEGQSLESLFNKKRRLSEKEAAGIMLQICEGLIFLNRNSVSIQSISLSGIVCTCDGTVKLIDFDTSVIGRSKLKQSQIALDISACGVLFENMISGENDPEGKKISRAAREISRRSKKTSLQFRSVFEMKNHFKRYGGVKDKLSYIKGCLPGFRTNRPLNKIIAAVVYIIAAYYVYCGVCLITLYRSQKNIPLGIFDIVFSFIMVIFPFFAASDFLYYRERLPFIRRLNRPLRTILGLIFTLWCYFFIGVRLTDYILDCLYYIFNIS